MGKTEKKQSRKKTPRAISRTSVRKSSVSTKRNTAPNAYLVGVTGNRIFIEACDRDFFPLVNAGLQKAGFSDDPSSFSLKPSGKRSFRADAGLSWTATVGVFVLLQSASWACKTIFDEIYKPSIRPAIAKTLKRLMARDEMNSNPSFDFSTWLEPIQIMITIRISGSSGHGVLESEKHSERAFEFAQNWLSQRGATHKFITVVIHDGVVCEIPILSDEALPRRQVTHFP